MEPSILHLNTYFLFPFSLDKEAVMGDRPDIWKEQLPFFDGLDAWIESARRKAPAGIVWNRATYTRFDMDSEAYQTMVFFHPFVRRVFFDAADPVCRNYEQESLINCYQAPADGLVFLAEDSRGRSMRLKVTDLRMFLFANGIGILSLGVGVQNLSARDALWINEMARKIYPSSARQLREGRVPSRLALILERDGAERIIADERFESGTLAGFQPSLSATITTLLYFADYSKREYEAVLDDRMLVYSYLTINRDSVPAYYSTSPEFEVLLSRILYVDRYAESFRYDPEFTRASMNQHLYRRWSHQGTWYGFTTYSNVTVTFGEFDCDDHNLNEGFLVHRMFDHRYYLMAIVALFYRATLLDFSERIALVSKQLYLDYADNELSPDSIALAARLRADFLHFANYWYFDELANKDEEMEHFRLQCSVYRIGELKMESEEEVEKLSASLNDHYQIQSAGAVNRLAVSSMLLGAGAVITGYFGMNFAKDFGAVFFEPQPPTPEWVHYAMILFVSAVAVGSVLFGLVLIIANWREYKHILLPQIRSRQAPELQSLRRGPGR